MLTITEIKNFKAQKTPYRKADGEGLYLLIRPAKTKSDGVSKLWRFKYRFGGKEKLLALGSFPDVSLAEAREKKAEARKELRQGIDPSAVKKATKTGKSTDSFETVAREWHEKHTKVEWSKSHSKNIMARLEKHIFPWIGNISVNEIKAIDILDVLRRIENKGHLETLHRTLSNCSSVFIHAIATQRAINDPCNRLSEAFPKPIKHHFSTILEPEKVGQLLRNFDNYEGEFIVKCALRLAPLVFLRSIELRLAEWQEIDLDSSEWRIPIRRMKRTRRDKEAFPNEVHLVPLARQSIAILEELHPLTGNNKLVFPGPRTRVRAISDMTMTAAVRRMGYSSDDLHVHGFRAMARTMIHEQLKINPEIIERQMSHAVDNPLGKAYDRTSFIPERKDMMQQWADYLDKLKQTNRN